MRRPSRTRGKQPFRNFPATDELEPLEEKRENDLESSLPSLDAGDGRVSLACVSCRQSNPLEENAVRLEDNSVLVGQQKAREKTLFLDADGQTTTTPIPRFALHS